MGCQGCSTCANRCLFTGTVKALNNNVWRNFRCKFRGIIFLFVGSMFNRRPYTSNFGAPKMFWLFSKKAVEKPEKTLSSKPTTQWSVVGLIRQNFTPSVISHFIYIMYTHCAAIIFEQFTGTIIEFRNFSTDQQGSAIFFLIIRNVLFVTTVYYKEFCTRTVCAKTDNRPYGKRDV